MTVPPTTLERTKSDRLPPVVDRAAMMRHRRGRRVAVLLAVVGAAAVVQPARAKDEVPSKSAPGVAALSKQLDQAKPQSDAMKPRYIAARDPGEEGRYVAAMYIPGVQILVISAKYATPVLLNEKLISAKYEDIYVDLSSASERASRVFIEDLKANGILRSKPKAPPFDVYEVGGRKVTFDFDWRRQKGTGDRALTEDEYLKALETADELYTRLLALLLEQAKKP